MRICIRRRLYPRNPSIQCQKVILSVMFAVKPLKCIVSLIGIKRLCMNGPKKHTDKELKCSAPAGIRTRVTDSKGRYT